jgi:hypothetical protein
MGTSWRYFYAALAVLATVALSVIAYKLIGGQLTNVGSSREVAIDYTNLVVILLTTVTVLFTVCALALAVLGIIGFRSLKKDAGRFASEQALSAISSSFDEGGPALAKIQDEFTKEDGHLKKWTQGRIRREVIALLPLVIDRLPGNVTGLGIDEDAATDEGQVD